MKKKIIKTKYIIIIVIFLLILGLFSLYISASDSLYNNYLALGDSITEGYTPFADKYPGYIMTNERYSKLVKDYYEIDNYTNLAESGQTCAQFVSYIKTDDVTRAIKEADLITISIGSNELLGIALKYFGNISLDGLGNTIDAIKQFTSFYNALKNDSNGEIAAAIKTYEEKWEESIRYIKSINPNAEIVVLEFYNPYYDVNVVGFKIGDLIDGYIDQMNQILWSQSEEGGVTGKKYKIAEIREDFEVTNPRLTNVNVSLTDLSNFNYDPHPTVAGHKKIFEKVKAVLSSIKHIKNTTAGEISVQNYTGSPIEPDVIVKDGNKTLKKDVDYIIVSYRNNIELGKAWVDIKGKGDYAGVTSIPFQINQASIEKFKWKISTDTYEYTGEEIKPDVIRGAFEDIPLEQGDAQNPRDYVVTYTDNTDVGTATVMISGRGNYGNAVRITYKIEPKDIEDLDVVIESNQIYDGTEKEPDITIKYGDIELEKDWDYEVIYSDNVNAGTGKVTIEGYGNYQGKIETTFDILAKDISAVTVEEIADREYTGTAMSPVIKLEDEGVELTQNTDYTVAYSNNTNAGTATVTITGIGNYQGEASATFDITKKDINTVTVESISDKEYTGTAITPVIEISDAGIKLEKDIDYTVAYSDNTNAGTATVTITGKGNYQGEASKTFDITKRDIDTVTFKEISDQEYKGTAITPVIEINDASVKLEEGIDYIVAYGENLNVGTGTITIEGLGSCYGTKTIMFDITAKDINTVTFNETSDQTYTGEKIKPEIEVKDESVKLNEGTDYTIVYGENLNVGTGTITIEGIGNCYGIKTITFDITSKNISSAVTVEQIPDQTYTGERIEPEIKVEDEGVKLEEGTDYTVAYSNNTNAGTATVTITGKGNYQGETSKTFDITKKDINTVTVESISDKEYTGTAITPVIEISNEGVKLEEGTDYEAIYSDNINAGTAKVTITGKGNYKGEVERTFNITKRDISAVTVETITDQEYTGRKIIPVIKINEEGVKIEEGTDYTVVYGENLNVGTGTITITGKGNCYETKVLTFNIMKRDINTVTFKEISNQEYTGTAITPVIEINDEGVRLEEGTDYTVVYGENLNVGEGTVTITGKGNCYETKVLTFNITKREISTVTFKGISDQEYTGTAIMPAIKLEDEGAELIQGTDYIVTYGNNINVGKATVTITGKGNYQGEAGVTFNIIQRNISSVVTVDAIPDQTYTGEKIEPEIKVEDEGVKLEEGADYTTVAYGENVNVGTGTITITGIGNYQGEVELTFNITKRDISTITVEQISDQTYTGEEIKPEIEVKDESVKLNEGTDYTVEYGENLNVGTGTITIEGIGNCYGIKILTFNIETANIGGFEWTLSTDVYEYTGGKIKPDVILEDDSDIDLVEGIDYTVVYSDNVNVGEAKLIILGKGNYKGYLEKTFYIIEKTPEDTKPEDTKPEDTKPEDTKPEDTKPEDTKPEDTKPEDTKPEDTKPEDTKPEDTKPEDTKPEDTKPEDTKPEDTKPEDIKPEDTKPEDTKPEDDKKDDSIKEENKLPQTGNKVTKYTLIFTAIIAVVMCFKYKQYKY